MLIFKRLLFGAVGLCFAQNLQAQHHNNLWLRSTLTAQIAPKLAVDAEFQHRRQNGLEDKNRFAENLMFSYRTWINYQHSAAKKFSLSPLAYFSNYKIIQQAQDDETAPKSEFRLSAAVDTQHELFKKIFITGRSAVEYRMFNTSAKLTRLRNRVGLRYDVSDKLKLGIYDELLFNIYGTTPYYFFDHDRLGFSFTYQLLSDIKVETGYMKISRLPIASYAMIH